MSFGSRAATSIDLCCRDLISSSVYGPSTHVLASYAEDAFLDMDIHPFPATSDRSTRRRVSYAVSLIRQSRPDIVVVQQHLPSAAAIAHRVNTPVVLHRHNFQKSYESTTFIKRIRRNIKVRSFKALAGIIHVSQACEVQFSADWPELSIPRTIVPNGFDPRQWRPAQKRTKEILCVGRCAPEKGILETAQALAAVLPDQPEWRAQFILSAVESNRDYYAKVLSELEPLKSRIAVRVQRPYKEIIATFEKAAIAVVPSLCRESFGRTALEAHAGGAALISSGAGALREVSGDHALYVDKVEPKALAQAMQQLIAASETRKSLAHAARERAQLLYTNIAASAQADTFFEWIHEQHSGPKILSSMPTFSNTRVPEAKLLHNQNHTLQSDIPQEVP
jgi:glycosyltransferase involved in cell wall biosynthesis